MNNETLTPEQAQAIEKLTADLHELAVKHPETFQDVMQVCRELIDGLRTLLP